MDDICRVALVQGYRGKSRGPRCFIPVRNRKSGFRRLHTDARTPAPNREDTPESLKGFHLT